MKKFINSLFSAGGLFILTIMAARLVFLQQIHLALTPDEAYYWDWSRHLAWGYYSKPPMVAWLIALSTHKLGLSEYAVRIPAIFCGALYLIFIYYLAYNLFDQQVGLWAMLAAAVTPILAVYSFVMTIDPPLFALWAIALYIAWKAAETKHIKDFFITGIIIGLGLLTKQTMIAFPILYFLWLWLDKSKRNLLHHPGPYLVLIVAFVLILPNIVWNAKHNWIMFKHTSTHFEAQGLNFLGPLQFIGEQAGVITPIIFGLMVFVFITFITKPKLREQSSLLYLFVFSAIPLALVLPLSFWRKVNANWPAPFYTSGFILLTVLALRVKWPKERHILIRRLFLLGVALGMIITVVVYRLPVMPQKFPPKIAAILYKFYGWKALASQVKTLRPQNAIIITSDRDCAAELAFYLPDHPNTYTLWSGKIRSQYDIWNGLAKNLGKDAIIITKSWPKEKELALCFDKVYKLKDWEKDLIGGRKMHVKIFFGKSLKTCQLIETHP